MEIVKTFNHYQSFTAIVIALLAAATIVAFLPNFGIAEPVRGLYSARWVILLGFASLVGLVIYERIDGRCNRTH